MSYPSITDPDNQYSEVIRSMDFYNEDLKILKHRLAEVASKNNSFEARQGIEHFQNQFDIQQHNIHDLKHKFRDNQHLMSVKTLAHTGHAGLEQIEKEKELINEYTLLEKVIKDLRQEFNIFLSKWMRHKLI